MLRLSIAITEILSDGFGEAGAPVYQTVQPSISCNGPAGHGARAIPETENQSFLQKLLCHCLSVYFIVNEGMPSY